MHVHSSWSREDLLGRVMQEITVCLYEDGPLTLIHQIIQMADMQNDVHKLVQNTHLPNTALNTSFT